MYSGIERRLEADGAVGCQLQWQEGRPTPVPVFTTRRRVSRGRWHNKRTGWNVLLGFDAKRHRGGIGLDVVGHLHDRVLHRFRCG